MSKHPGKIIKDKGKCESNIVGVCTYCTRCQITQI